MRPDHRRARLYAAPGTWNQGRTTVLQVSNLSKRIGDTLLFEKANFVINAGERVGLVGPNGCGKTSLLRILMGQEPADTGSARFVVPAQRVGYLAQPWTTPRRRVLRDAPGQRGGATRTIGPPVSRNWPATWSSAHRGGPQAGRCPGTRIRTGPGAAPQACRRPPDTWWPVLAGWGGRSDGAHAVDILIGGLKTRMSLARILLENPLSGAGRTHQTTWTSRSGVGWKLPQRLRRRHVDRLHDRTFSTAP